GAVVGEVVEGPHEDLVEDGRLVPVRLAAGGPRVAEGAGLRLDEVTVRGERFTRVRHTVQSEVRVRTCRLGRFGHPRTLTCSRLITRRRCRVLAIMVPGRSRPPRPWLPVRRDSARLTVPPGLLRPGGTVPSGSSGPMAQARYAVHAFCMR